MATKTDSFGTEYTVPNDTVVHTDRNGAKRKLVKVPGENKHRFLYVHKDGDSYVTTLEKGYTCPQCKETEPSLHWATPAATFSCDECGFLGLGTRLQK